MFGVEAIRKKLKELDTNIKGLFEKYNTIMLRLKQLECSHNKVKFSGGGYYSIRKSECEDCGKILEYYIDYEGLKEAELKYHKNKQKEIEEEISKLNGEN